MPRRPACPPSSYTYALYQTTFGVTLDDLTLRDDLTAAELAHHTQQHLHRFLDDEFACVDPTYRWIRDRDEPNLLALWSTEQRALDAYRAWLTEAA